MLWQGREDQMTHDELLELIAANEEFYGDGTNRTPSWTALREVVELHKPIIHALPDETCWACQDLYPCPTIQAIEKELDEKWHTMNCWSWF